MILGGNRPLSGPDHLTQAVFRDVPLSRAPKPLKPLVVDADVALMGITKWLMIKIYTSENTWKHYSPARSNHPRIFDGLFG